MPLLFTPLLAERVDALDIVLLTTKLCAGNKVRHLVFPQYPRRNDVSETGPTLISITHLDPGNVVHCGYSVIGYVDVFLRREGPTTPSRAELHIVLTMAPQILVVVLMTGEHGVVTTL